MLPRRARCILSRLRCNGPSLLLRSYLSRIGRIKYPCSACGHSSQNTSHFILHCLATDSAPLVFWRLSVSLRPLVQALGSCPASGAPWPFAMPPSLGRGLVTTTTTTLPHVKYSARGMNVVRRYFKVGSTYKLIIIFTLVIAFLKNQPVR